MYVYMSLQKRTPSILGIINGDFWSVMMNYVVPNPTFEKALIIGSSEGENAFNNIKKHVLFRWLWKI